MGRHPAPKKLSVGCISQACHQVIDKQDDTWDLSRVSEAQEAQAERESGKISREGWQTQVRWLRGSPDKGTGWGGGQGSSTWLVLRHMVSTLWAMGSPEGHSTIRSLHPHPENGLEGGWLGGWASQRPLSHAGERPRNLAGK